MPGGLRKLQPEPAGRGGPDYLWVLAVDRDRVAELLGFDGPVENSCDAIGGADYLGEAATALGLSFLGLGRFVNDLLLWSTQEFGAIRVADPYVQVSFIMPQKRNPVSLAHVRRQGSWTGPPMV